MTRDTNTDRRSFLKTASLAGAGAALAGQDHALADHHAKAEVKTKISLGYDNFAVRAMKWKAPQLIDYAAELECDTLFITDFGPLEKLDDDKYLGDLAKSAADKGVNFCSARGRSARPPNVSRTTGAPPTST